MLSKVNIAPGIDKETTNYGAEGRWIDCTNVRFRAQLPEKIGGWTKLVAPKICGVVRAQKLGTQQPVLGLWLLAQIENCMCTQRVL